MKKCFWGIAAATILFSCSSLKEVHSFAENSVKGIAKINAVEHSFAVACSSKCTNRQAMDSLFSAALNCDCKAASHADKSLKKVLTALQTYFKQLGQFSNSKLSEVSVAAIEQPLVANEYFKKSTLKPYATVIENILEAANNKYRVRMLKTHLKKSYSAVDTLLYTSSFIITNNLIPAIRNSQSELSQIYLDLHVDNANSKFEKFVIQKTYFKELAVLSDQEKKLKTYVKTLERIRLGYHELNLHKNRLKKNEIRKLIASYSEALNAIFSNL